MKTLKRFAGLLTAYLAAVAAFAQDDPAEWPQRELTFEFVKDALYIPDPLLKHEGDRPRYVASFAMIRPDNSGSRLIAARRRGSGGRRRPAAPRTRPAAPRTYSLAFVGQRDRDSVRILKMRAASAFSEEQRTFVSTSDSAHKLKYQNGQLWRYSQQRVSESRYDLALPALQLAGTEDGVDFYLAYGMTQDDARSMAEALIELVEGGHRYRFESTKKALTDARIAIREVRAELPKAEDEIRRQTAELEKAKQGALYDGAEEALQDLRELGKTLRAIDVEITGVQAKIEATRRHKARVKRDLDTLAVLERLLIEQDINLAGALARRNAIERHRANAQAFYDATVGLQAAVEQRDALNKTLAKQEKNAQWEEKLLGELPSDMMPIVVLENKVVIQEIK